MKKVILLAIFLMIGGSIVEGLSKPQSLRLPAPTKKGKVSLEEALDARQSVRDYVTKPFTTKEVSQMLWAAYGENKWGKLTSPSAGATYPLTIYIIAGKVEDLPVGMYKYNNRSHSVTLVKKEDLRADLSGACLNQPWVREAPLVIIICADYSITTSRYGARGKRYVDIELGHVGQNIYLEATALGLGTVAVGAFDDRSVKAVLDVKEDPLYIFPVGVRK